MKNSRHILITLFIITLSLIQDNPAKASSVEEYRQQIKKHLIAGDSMQACNDYKLIKLYNDSVAKVNYKKEVKALRDKYEIDSLYVENQQQRAKNFRLITIFLLLFVLLFIAIFFRLRKENRCLREAKESLSSQRQATEKSIQATDRLLYSVSKRMKSLLQKMASELRSDKISQKKGIDEIMAQSNELMDIYHEIIR